MVLEEEGLPNKSLNSFNSSCVNLSGLCIDSTEFLSPTYLLHEQSFHSLLRPLLLKDVLSQHFFFSLVVEANNLVERMGEVAKPVAFGKPSSPQGTKKGVEVGQKRYIYTTESV